MRLVAFADNPLGLRSRVKLLGVGVEAIINVSYSAGCERARGIIKSKLMPRIRSLPAFNDIGLMRFVWT